MRRAVALLAGLVLVGGCGGGGDDDREKRATTPTLQTLPADVDPKAVEEAVFVVRAGYACEEVADGLERVRSAESEADAEAQLEAMRRAARTSLRVLKRDRVPRDAGAREFYAALEAQIEADRDEVEEAFDRLRFAARDLGVDSEKCLREP